MNESIAVVGNNALVLDVPEENLDKEVSEIEERAKGVIISSDDDYALAVELTAEIKRTQKKVTEYWEPMRASTYKAYQDVLDHKKEMITPLESAEKILKKKMATYVDEKERQRKEMEEAARKAAQEEAERKLNEAVAMSEDGREDEAEFAMAEAEVMYEAAATSIIQPQAPKANGVSTTKAWEIISIDEEKVPIDVNGAVVRPVDQKAIMALIKASKGKIAIPGVKYRETVSISVRT